MIFFGMTGGFSLPPLTKLIEAQHDIAAVVVPARSPTLGQLPHQLILPPPAVSDIPLLNPHFESNIIHLAWQHDIPVWEIADLRDKQTLSFLTELQPEIIVVACFSRLFPAALLQLPRFGCLNLHPSLLPAYRGPAPLFWQAQQGRGQTGVTLHLLDEGIDSGDIVAQQSLSWPEGATEAALDQRCAELGAELLVTALERLGQTQSLPRQPQVQETATYFPWPSEDDFKIPTTWSAQRAFNFLRFGQANWPLWIEAEQQQIFVRKVLGYEAARLLPQPGQKQGDELWLQFKPGVLRLIPEKVF